MRGAANLLAGLFRTQERLDERDVHRGTRTLMVDGVCSASMVTLQGGPFLAAFVLAIGGSAYEVGLLATIAFGSQLMQLPGLYLLTRLPKRRGLVVLAAGLSRLLWLPIVLIPVLFLNRGVTFLMQWLVLAAMVGALAGPAWNSLIRDVIPQEKMGHVFSRRMALSTTFALSLTLLGGFFIDAWKGWFAGDASAAAFGYALLFAVGLGFGLIGLIAVSRLPEPTMQAQSGQSILELLAKPVRDTNFRGLLRFIAFWNFSVNLAAPFFIIYLLNRIGLSLSWVTALTVTSQLTNLIFLRIWGRLADRYSNKSVLAVSGPLFLLAVLGWTFTTMPDRYALTLPLLFAIHILSGMSLAGVSLASANIALKLSPPGQAHAYMAAYGLAGAVTGAVAPMIGGVVADFFAVRELAIPIQWRSPAGEVQVYAMHFASLDFLFGLAFVLGLVSLKLLGKVTEAGEVEEQVVRDEFRQEVLSTARSVSTVPGVRYLVGMPVAMLYRLTRGIPGVPAPRAEPPPEEP